MNLQHSTMMIFHNSSNHVIFISPICDLWFCVQYVKWINSTRPFSFSVYCPISQFTLWMWPYLLPFRLHIFIYYTYIQDYDMENVCFGSACKTLNIFINTDTFKIVSHNKHSISILLVQLHHHHFSSYFYSKYASSWFHRLKINWSQYKIVQTFSHCNL